MIMLLIAVQVSQVQPVLKPVQTTASPKIMLAPAATRRHQMVTDGEALLAQAQAASRNYTLRAGQPSKAELEASISQVKGDLDSMSEMGETESLKLQMAMDRLSKMMSTLSNLLKKMSDTDQSITNNIK